MFTAIIDTCIDLQYKLELAISGMADNPLDLSTATQKLPWLRQHRSTWMKLSKEKLMEETQQIKLREAWCKCALIDGIFAQLADFKSIEFRQLPSQMRRIVAKTWIMEIPCATWGFTMDAGQDLLILLEEFAPGSA